MSDHAKTVLWIGLLMIVFSVVLHWSEIKSLIFSGSGSSKPSSSSTLAGVTATVTGKGSKPGPLHIITHHGGG